MSDELVAQRADRGRGPSSFAEMIRAIGDEVDALERDPSKRFEVTNGEIVHRGLGGDLYAFSTDAELPLQPETRLTLRVGDDRFRGTLVAVDDFGVLVHVTDPPEREIRSAVVTTEPAYILDRLRERLTELAAGRQGLEGGVAGILENPENARVGVDFGAAEHAATELEQLDDLRLVPNDAQRLAMARVAGSDLHFVWGPPGTGKTACLAQIVRMLVEQDERVLVLAHANVAVDVAAMRVADAIAPPDELLAGRIVRVGAPRHPDALDRTEILVEGAVAQRAPAMVRDRQRLERERTALHARLRSSTDRAARDLAAAELRRVREQLRRVLQRYEEESERVVLEASVVCATLSRLVLSDLVWSSSFDAVVVDEASMVSFPWVLAAAARARTRLVVLGDFRQLPPVYVSRTELAHRWLGRDAFDVAGVRERIDSGEADDRVTLLDTQYRMARPIGDAIGAFAYGGRLRTDPDAASRAATIAGKEPWPGQSLVLVDTTGILSACQTEPGAGSFSRFNAVHALLCLSMASVSGGSMSLVTPYRAQARILAAGVRDLGLDAAAATIHRFQGSERDVAFFDVPDALPSDGPSRLTGGDVDLALRLLNVGLSRARGRAVLVADVGFAESRLGPSAPLRRAIDLCREHGTEVAPDAGDVALAFEGGTITWLDSRSDVVSLLSAEITRAHKEVWVNAPDGWGVDDDLVSALVHATRRVRVSMRQRVVIRDLEATDASIGLLAQPGFFAHVDDRVSFVGGRPGSPVAVVRGLSLVGALRALTVGGESEATRRRMISA